MFHKIHTLEENRLFFFKFKYEYYLQSIRGTTARRRRSTSDRGGRKEKPDNFPKIKEKIEGAKGERKRRRREGKRRRVTTKEAGYGIKNEAEKF